MSSRTFMLPRTGLSVSRIPYGRLSEAALRIWRAFVQFRGRVLSAALQAIPDLDAERSKLYFDLVHFALSEAARRALRNMDPATIEELDAIGERLLTAQTLHEALNGP